MNEGRGITHLRVPAVRSRVYKGGAYGSGKDKPASSDEVRSQSE